MFRFRLITCCILLAQNLHSQDKKAPIADYHFNNTKGEPHQEDHPYILRSCEYVEDRFGNKEYAVYFMGHPESHVNLGSNTILKNKGTISLWFNMHGLLGTGNGVESNPIFSTRSHSGEDCNDALYLGVDMNTRKLNGSSLNSAVEAITIYSRKPVKMANWHHAVLTYDDEYLALYFDGVLEYKAHKKFRTVFNPGDSIMLGHRSSQKNNRYFLGAIDDIKIYDKVLDDKEIMALYLTPDPDTSRKNLAMLGKGLLIITGLGLFLWLVKLRVKRLLRQEKEKNMLQNHMYEQEIRVLKAQMDPHFIFNSLNTIQQFIIVDDNAKAQLYLTKFSSLMRKLLETNKNDNICLHDEIDILRSYIEIESLRFNNIFSYSITIDKHLEDGKVNIPHFMVQPVVENAIWHGLLPKAGEKRLDVTFSKVNDKTLSCIIEDNGIGRLKSAQRVSRREKTSLALAFIKQRLELMKRLFNTEYCVEIIDKMNGSQPGGGTKVIITMPIFNN